MAEVHAALVLMEVRLRLLALGVPTVDGGQALAAVEDLLRALHVETAPAPVATQYRVRLIVASPPRIRQSALAGDETAAVVLARAWSALPDSRAGRTVVVVEPVAVGAAAGVAR